MSLADLQLQFDYIYWARDRVLPIVEGLSAEAFTRDMGSSHSSIRDTMVHMVGSERLWMTRWKGESPTGRLMAEDVPTIDVLRTRWMESEAAVRGHLSAMRPGDENALVQYTTLDGAPVAYPFWQTAVQVTNHSSYHRGQIVTMLRQQGIAGVGTDFIMYFKIRNANG